MTEPEDPTYQMSVEQTRAQITEELPEELEVRRRKARAQIAASQRDERERRRARGIEDRSANGASLVEYRVGSRTYPYKTAPSCKVCNSPWRIEIEKYLASGRTAGWITRTLPEQAKLGYQNIRDHRLKHLPPELANTVALIEQRAEEKGLAIQHGQELMLDEISLARMVVQRVGERMATGDIEPTVAEGLAAGRWLSTVGPDGNAALDTQAITASLVRYFELARDTMTREQWPLFLERVRTDPVLAALSDRQEVQSAVEDDEVLEAEVVG